MKVGETWEMFNGSTGEVRTYRLEHFEKGPVKGLMARLHRLDDDGEPMAREQGDPPRIAQVLVYTLLRGEKKPGPTGTYWRKVADAPMPEFETAAEAA